MAMAIHPYISGQPHRIKYLEAVYDHIGRHAGVIPGRGCRGVNREARAVNERRSVSCTRARGRPLLVVRGASRAWRASCLVAPDDEDMASMCVVRGAACRMQ